MSLLDWVLLSGCAALLGWLNSFPSGIPLEKNLDKQPPKGQAKQKDENQSPEEDLAPLPKSWCLASPKESKQAFKVLRLLTSSCVQGLTTGQNRCLQPGHKTSSMGGRQGVCVAKHSRLYTGLPVMRDSAFAAAT